MFQDGKPYDLAACSGPAAAAAARRFPPRPGRWRPARSR